MSYLQLFLGLFNRGSAKRAKIASFGGSTLNFEKMAILFGPSSFEIDTSGGHISSTFASWEVQLGCLPLGSPLQKYIKIRKGQKMQEPRVWYAVRNVFQ